MVMANARSPAHARGSASAAMRDATSSGGESFERSRRLVLKRLILATEWCLECAQALWDAGDVVRAVCQVASCSVPHDHPHVLRPASCPVVGHQLTYSNQVYVDKIRTDYQPLLTKSQHGGEEEGVRSLTTQFLMRKRKAR